MKQNARDQRPRAMARELGENVYFRGAGAVVRNHRESRGLTLDSLATELGVDKSTLSRWETNTSPLGPCNQATC